MFRTNVSIPCIWGGNLEGFVLKSDKAADNGGSNNTKKIICIHGWLDNLNSFLPVAEKLVTDGPNYEILLYDRAGHGFSSHLPKGCEYSMAHVVQDLHCVVLNLGWEKTKFSILGHSYGAIYGITYAACYPEEVECVVAMDSIPWSETPTEDVFKAYRTRIDASLQFHTKPPRPVDYDITTEGFIQLTKLRRPGLTDEGVKLIVERSVRRDKDNKLRITFDEAIKVYPVYPYTDELVRSLFRNLKASTLVIFTKNVDEAKYKNSFDYMREFNPNFELELIDGPHDFHLTHVKEVVDLIERYFDKYLK
ncbi:unnamed protein product [Rotaria socialis]|uniref:AB hydrolase-1 domain-containing protein n=2 Tax=Rotaria socialis TaxID=392032 RepID=A0A818J7V2_9BILA|nr:unnamed protein product [Rotaria socialis]CAF4305549.1 unnamed protein product [Rotaria socialis]